MLASRPAVAWWEVHSENFFVEGGSALDFLTTIRDAYPVSLHGVSASLGGVDTLFERHLHKLARLVAQIQPAAVSEHLCWSSVGTHHFNDLLPLPYTQASLKQVCARIDRMQEVLGRAILVENVSSYLQWRLADFSEWDFLVEVARRSGCRILLDINNIHVSAANHEGFDAYGYVDAIPAGLIGEIHLAGYDHCDDFLVDTHGHPVSPPVWKLYEYALRRIGPKPTLIEWDTDIPALSVLMEEAARADLRMGGCHAVTA